MKFSPPDAPWWRKAFAPLELRCMDGWCGLFCVIDELTPHRHLTAWDDDGPYDWSEPYRGFRWACRLHAWAENHLYRRRDRDG